MGKEDEAFWAEAESLEMPVHIHINIGGGKRNAKEAAISAAAASENLNTMLGGMPFGSFPQTMSDIIHKGVFDRYPTLKMVGVEVQAGWVPAVLAWWDDRYWRNRSMTGCDLKMLPSDYFRRNWLVTFIIDRFAVKNREDVGVRKHHVVERLPAPRQRLALQPQGDLRHVRRRARA